MAYGSQNVGMMHLNALGGQQGNLFQGLYGGQGPEQNLYAGLMHTNATGGNPGAMASTGGSQSSLAAQAAAQFPGVRPGVASPAIANAGPAPPPQMQGNPVSPYTIGGGLPFGAQQAQGGMLGAAMSGNPQALASQYQSAYDASLKMNAQNYNNIMGGYQGLMANQQGNPQTGQGAILGAYGRLNSQVQNTLGFGGTPWGVAQPAATAIQQNLQQQQGSTTQNEINSGLGNSTVLGNLQAQNTGMANQALAGLGSQLAQTYAGYQTNIGESLLGYANQANQQNTNLGEQQLGFMNSVNARYPDPGQYYGLMQQQGAMRMGQQEMALQAQQQAANQQLQRQQLAQAGMGGQGGGAMMGGDPFGGGGVMGGGGMTGSGGYGYGSARGGTSYANGPFIGNDPEFNAIGGGSGYGDYNFDPSMGYA